MKLKRISIHPIIEYLVFSYFILYASFFFICLTLKINYVNYCDLQFRCFEHRTFIDSLYYLDLIAIKNLKKKKM